MRPSTAEASAYAGLVRRAASKDASKADVSLGLNAAAFPDRSSKGTNRLITECFFAIDASFDGRGFGVRRSGASRGVDLGVCLFELVGVHQHSREPDVRRGKRGPQFDRFTIKVSSFL